jgi:lysophospholipase
VSNAPLYTDVADGPSGGQAFWVQAVDGVRLRAAIWPGRGKGTVFVLPGRTEYIEKYGRAAGDLVARGFTTLSLDWRGQGLADRPLRDKMSGHVGSFSEYQKDLDAALKLAHEQDLPRPYFILAHSMGGCIALRGLMRGLPFQAAAFTAPMWGISMAAWMRPMAIAITTTAGWFGQKARYAPGTSSKTYVLEVPFQGNVLTSDVNMYDYMRQQAGIHPDLSLGGPSMGWLHAALGECHALSLLPSPPTPTICALGTSEKVVDTTPIHLRMRQWNNGRIDLYPGAEHEIMMETVAMRQRLFDSVADHFFNHS